MAAFGGKADMAFCRLQPVKGWEPFFPASIQYPTTFTNEE
jgi:hypothetical protein